MTGSLRDDNEMKEIQAQQAQAQQAAQMGAQMDQAAGIAKNLAPLISERRERPHGDGRRQPERNRAVAMRQKTQILEQARRMAWKREYRQRDLADLVDVLSTVQGRRLIQRIIGITGWFSTPVVYGNKRDDIEVGRRSIGVARSTA